MHWAEFDARYETTQYPADYLWGPGTRSAAAAWLEREQPQGDTIDHLDRVFLVRVHDGQILPPMRPEVAAGVIEAERSGNWYAVRADYPVDAFAHVRGRTEGSFGHARRGDCGACFVHVLGSGSHQQAIAAVAAVLGPVAPKHPPTVRVPHSRHWPDRP